MKINKLFFLFVIVLLATNSVTAFYFLVIKNQDFKKTASAQESTQESEGYDYFLGPMFIKEVFADADYGLNPEGIFFIKEKMFPEGTEDVYLILVESGPEANNRKRIEETEENRSIIKMHKSDGYYYAKPKKNYFSPCVYYKSGHFYLPTANEEAFEKERIVKNQYEGLLLRF